MCKSTLVVLPLYPSCSDNQAKSSWRNGLLGCRFASEEPGPVSPPCKPLSHRGNPQERSENSRWWLGRDLNPRPRDYESPALVRLRAVSISSVGTDCSMNLAYSSQSRPEHRVGSCPLRRAGCDDRFRAHSEVRGDRKGLDPAGSRDVRYRCASDMAGNGALPPAHAGRYRTRDCCITPRAVTAAKGRGGLKDSPASAHRGNWPLSG